MATSKKELLTDKKPKKQTEKKNSPKKASILISEGISLAFTSACAYIFTFFYEKSYADYFGIPNELITISLSRTLLFFAFIIGFLFFLIFVLDISTTLLGRLNRTVLITVLPLFLVSLIGIMQIYFYGIMDWKRWAGIFILIFLLALIQFGLPLFTQRQVAGYLNKLIAQYEHDGQDVNFAKLFANLFGLSPILLALLFVLGYVLSITAGTAEAVKKSEFLVLKSTPEIVVLRIYGDLAIGATFDRNSKELGDKFTFISIKQDAPTIFELENIGPLNRPKKQQTASINLTMLTSTPIATSANQTMTPTP